MSGRESTHPAPGAPRFDVPVPDSGYRWWYVDGISDDGRHGVVVIAFVGSVFSPYYYRARQAGAADPEHFCAINVGLYGPRSKRWAMTERGRRALQRDQHRFRVGPSGLRWRHDRLQIDINERCAPFAQRLAGRITLTPAAISQRVFTLDAGERHRWQPLAPLARIEVSMQRPGVEWAGSGYCDTNSGDRALEADFDRWNWSRRAHPGGTAITYAVTQRDGGSLAHALNFSSSGELSEDPLPRPRTLARGGWGVGREVRSEQPAAVLRTLEDTPFYMRSLLRIEDANQNHPVMHESLELKRFESAWVRCLLPFRMPRLA